MSLLIILHNVNAQENKEGFSISGHIQGLEDVNGFFYLYRPTKDLKGITDSVAARKGEFDFKGFVEHPVHAVIYFKGLDAKYPKSTIRFYLENSDIKISGICDSARFSNLQNVKITGSQLQAEADLALHEMEVYSGINKQREAYNKVNKADTAAVNQTIKDYNNSTVKMKEFILKYADDHRESMISLDLLGDLLSSFRDEETIDLVEAKVKNLGQGVQSLANATKTLKYITHMRKSFLIGKAPQNFEQPDKDGNLVKLSDYKGKYILLDFWASWCRPCRQENPHLLKVYEKFHEKGLEILAVSLDTKRDAWLAAVEKDKLPWKHISDLKKDNTIAAQFGISAIPDNFLIDPNGIVVARGLRGESLDKKLTELLK